MFDQNPLCSVAYQTGGYLGHRHTMTITWVCTTSENNLFYFIFLKLLWVFFHQLSNSGLGIGIGHRQPETWRKAKLKSLANAAVSMCYLCLSNLYCLKIMIIANLMLSDSWKMVAVVVILLEIVNLVF